MRTYSYYSSWVVSEKNSTILPAFILVLLFSSFAFTGGDEVRYEEFVTEDFDIDFHPIEPVYALIAGFVNGNYTYWRLIVYWSSVVLSFFAMKRMNCLNFTTITAYVLLALVSVGTTRGVLAYSIFVLGYSFFDSKYIWGKLIGVMLVLLSIAFHDSMLLPVVLTPLTLIKPTRGRLLLILFLTPLVAVLITYAFDFIGRGGNSEYLIRSEDKLGAYTERGGGTTDSFLMRVLIYLRYVVVTFLVFFALKAEQKLVLPRSVSSLIRVSLFLYIGSMVLFLTSPIQGAGFIATRYLTMIPFFLYITWPFYLNKGQVIKKGGLRLFILIVASSPLLYWLMQIYYFSVQQR